MSDNPLVDYPDLPPFSLVRPEHVQPAVDGLIASGRAHIQRVTASEPPFTWDSLVALLDEEDERLEKAFGPVAHLNAVAQTGALREAYNACLPKLSEYSTELSQDSALFRAFKDLRAGDQWDGLSTPQKKVVENALRDFRLGGVDLPEDSKQEYLANSKRLSELGSRFSDNLLDATQAWKKQVHDASLLEGLPDTALAGAADKAREEGLEGWLLTLDAPTFLAVMGHARNRDLREEMYRAWTTRASDQGPQAGRYDNSAIMEEILRLRHRQAELLGFANYAEKSLATRMAKSVNEVYDFIRGLAARARPRAQEEISALREFARDNGVDDPQAWDIPFYSERLREARYDVSQEALRPWFPTESVIDGMFRVVEKVFGVRFRVREDVDVWHPDVRFFEILDAGGGVQAAFYLDIYARTGKRGGAWMDECRVRRRRLDGTLQTPVAYLTCNFAPPAGGRPGLMTHDDVVTLFHEFGHGLHHMLTEQDIRGVSGINGVPWDAVELPSQFLENWCWTREGIELISSHHETGDPLPEEKLDRLLAARNFQSAMQMLRQLEFSLFDMRIHAEYEPGLSIQAVLDEVRDEIAVVRPPDFNRFQHGFGHVFAGGYAAGYYSYKWAEVLSADAWSRFQEEGVFNENTGRDFRKHILARGGSEDPTELFVAFRGRKPSIEPLLLQSGIPLS